LGAEKTVKRQRRRDSGKLAYERDEEGTPDFSKPIYEEASLPNLEVRVGSIYALERIAQDSDRDHIQIMEILCAYIRENAPAENAEPFPFEPSPDEHIAWESKVKGPRTDIRVALEIIGRRSKIQIELERHTEVRGSEKGYRLDLRGTCLQMAQLADMDFKNALFGESRMQGAKLTEAQMQGANFFMAQMQGTNFGEAQIQGAELYGAQMNEETSVSAADLRGAALKEVDFRNVKLLQKQVDEMFGDNSVELRAALNRPDHWPKEDFDIGDFRTQLSAWQKKIGYDPSEDTP
jgi:hypothetical protein